MIKTPNDIDKYDILTWSMFDEAIQNITNEFKNKSLDAIYGQPRGGLPLAVALSHTLNKPLVFDIKFIKDMKKMGKSVLWVDDIVDTKKTFNESKDNFTFFTSWVSRVNIYGLFHTNISNKWVIFPWETLNNAENDKESYIKKRTTEGYLE
jgi:hypoxanthine phosphoribosyltransferase